MAFKGFISYSHGPNGKLAPAVARATPDREAVVPVAHDAHIQGSDKPRRQPRFMELHRVGVERLLNLSFYSFPQRGSIQGSVYYFRSEFAEIAEQCKTESRLPNLALTHAAAPNKIN